MAAGIACHHHERFDGTGYPDGRKGLKIPLSVRIVALTDVFDTLTSKRVYKDAMAMDSGKAKAIIEEEKGKHFDPAVVVAYVARIQNLLAVRRSHKQQGLSSQEVADDDECGMLETEWTSTP